MCEKARETMKKTEAQNTLFHEQKAKPVFITTIATKVFSLLWICIVGTQK